ncbi:hypothetical protein EET67_06755 [Pseudaminobacter arsenicus]|uniref:Uncharacterized protein n=1 Tax=Borborobacter arsenicus TaxID=1851146 RepID=A0A432V831_9HYPH|nr:hypothetical protein [Pseudaminobacter arsenicus]RUM98334.1 hypothetical protein EET67_06755 [Pseudaminobacter arsenicus]
MAVFAGIYAPGRQWQKVSVRLGVRAVAPGLQSSGAGMNETADIVDEMLCMAKDPETFTKEDMAEMVLLAATEIIRLREFPPVWVRNKGGLSRRPSTERPR